MVQLESIRSITDEVVGIHACNLPRKNRHTNDAFVSFLFQYTGRRTTVDAAIFLLLCGEAERRGSPQANSKKITDLMSEVIKPIDRNATRASR